MDRLAGLRVVAASGLLAALGCPEPAHVTESWKTLGATLSAEVYTAGPDDAAACLDDMREQLELVASAMDEGSEASELSRLNRDAADDYFAVQSADLYRLIRLALDYAQFSGGAYDPTLGPIRKLWERKSNRPPTPTEIDLALQRVGWDRVVVASEARALRFGMPGMDLDLERMVRGFALDAAGRAFARPGSYGGLLRLGDSLLAWNTPPGEPHWSVAIEDPLDPGVPLLTLAAANRGIAVAAHRGAGPGRIFDPATGRPASSDVRVVVAVADSVADATALSAALFVTGSARGGDLLGRMIRAEAVMLVEGNGEPALLASASLDGKLETSSELAAEIEGRIRYILPPLSVELASPLRGR